MILYQYRYVILVLTLLSLFGQTFAFPLSPSSKPISKPKPPPPIIACSSPAEVQRAISFYLKPNDCVLELGAQLSDTSRHLCRTVGEGGKVVMVDVKRKEATTGRSSFRDTTCFIKADQNSSTRTSNDDTYTNNDNDSDSACDDESFIDRVQYEELEQFDQWRSLAHRGQEKRKYQAMILDVGTMIGNDLYLSALSLANEFIANHQESPPRVIIVKSRTLSNLARRIIHSQRLLDGSAILPNDNDMERTDEPIVVPCVGVTDYRRTIPFLVKPGDDVIEVGCHFGRTTTLLHDAVNADSGNGFCVGVDIGSKIITNAKKQYPHVMFEVVDAWKTLDLLKVKVKNGNDNFLGYDVVYADIGGLSGAHGLLESLALLDAIAKALEPRSIVIKSLCVNRLASQLVPFSVVWNKMATKD